MIRKAFLITTRKGRSNEYIKRHNPIWKELEIVLKAHGVANYSIFLHEDSEMLFGYLEAEDELLLEELGRQDVMKRWWKHMTEVLECDREHSDKAKEHSLKEIFHLH